MSERHISVYRVGILYALWFDWRSITISHRWPRYTLRDLRRVWEYARAGKWRTVRQHFDGWHAEDEFAGYRCGTGWTRARALADLRRHLDEVGMRPGGTADAFETPREIAAYEGRPDA